MNKIQLASPKSVATSGTISLEFSEIIPVGLRHKLSMNLQFFVPGRDILVVNEFIYFTLWNNVLWGF